MADHYKVLGVAKSASKDQIKDAFRKLAVQFHPDKHAQSSKSARDEATLKFKQLSQAYEVLIDDRKRAAYNSRSNPNPNPNPNYSYDSNYYYRGGSYTRPPPPRSSAQSSRFVLKWEAVFRYMSTRAFLINIAFAGILLGGTVAIDMSGETLWKTQNSGKSFEEAMRSIEKNRGRKDQD